MGPMDAPDKRFGNPTEFETELASQDALLEAMFDDPGLARLRRRHPNHPAVRRHQRLLEGRNVSSDEDVERRGVQDLAQGMLDRLTWGQEPEARPFWASIVADPRQARQIERRISDPAQYDDTTLELFVWGALRYAGLAAELQERDGEPDSRLEDLRDTRWLEVKRIHLDTLPNRIHKVLLKANRQISKVSPDKAGTVYLFVETAGEAAVFDDALPSDVDRYVVEIRGILASAHHKRVGQVVVGWDDFMVLGHFPEPVLYAVRRRAIVLDHANPVSRPSEADWPAVFGFSVTMWIRPSTPSVTPPCATATKSPGISQLFQDRNNWPGGIRASHARRVLASPDGRLAIPLPGGGMSVVLLTKRIDLADPAHLILLVGYEPDGGELTVCDGFRLRASEAELEAWRHDPSSAFDALLRRFALPISIGPGPAQLFHLHWTGPAEPVLAVHEAPDPHVIAGFVKYSPPLWHADWVYAIDDAAYRADNHQ